MNRVLRVKQALQYVCENSSDESLCQNAMEYMGQLSLLEDREFWLEKACQFLVNNVFLRKQEDYSNG